MKRPSLKQTDRLSWLCILVFAILFSVGLGTDTAWLCWFSIVPAALSLFLMWTFYRCPHCGGYLGRSGRRGFCPHCGHKLPED